MSMHLEGPWLSTTRTKARGEKTTKAQREELERDWRSRNVRLKEMGLQKESFEQFLEWIYGRGKAVAQQKSGREKTAVAAAKTREDLASSDSTITQNPTKAKSLGLWITGPCSSKPSPVYTGTKVKGIGTMHKSNAVPIFSDDEAKDISSMRR